MDNNFLSWRCWWPHLSPQPSWSSLIQADTSIMAPFRWKSQPRNEIYRDVFQHSEPRLSHARAVSSPTSSAHQNPQKSKGNLCEIPSQSAGNCVARFIRSFPQRSWDLGPVNDFNEEFDTYLIYWNLESHCTESSLQQPAIPSNSWSAFGRSSRGLWCWYKPKNQKN